MVRLRIHASRDLIVVVSVLVIGIAGSGCMQPKDDDSAENTDVSASTAGQNLDPIAQGRAAYMKYCQSCHGASATGDGPVASLLKVPPADLTQLTTKYGSYPVDKVYNTIDGRQAPGSHGTRQMPVWGNVWTDREGGADAEERITRQINELVEYLRTVQQIPVDK